MKKYATNNGVWNTSKVLASPLLNPLRPVLEGAAWPSSVWPTMDDYQSLLEKHQVKNCHGHALKAVPASPLSDFGHGAYEASVNLHATLHTRLENWHDCFNLLTWCTFPLSKAALNAAHLSSPALPLSTPARAGARTPAQDALTQFDESGAVLVCADPELSELLKAFQWKQVFWERRAAVSASLRCFVFGHGLMEKALTPYLGLTAKACLFNVGKDFMQASFAEQLAVVDKKIAALLTGAQAWSHPRDLLPLPILGMPGYSPDNQEARYYDNLDYFRPGRRGLV